MTKGNILVTGASSGIGRACAVRLAGLGYRVFAGIRYLPAAEGEELQALAPELELVLLDVTDSASIRQVVETIGGEPLAGLVNNAGIATVGPLELAPLEDWRRQFEVNVIGLVAVTQACLPALRRGKGRIVNIGSIAGRSALPCTVAYDASKFAVEAISDSLRLELDSFGIRVSLIEPGAVATAIWEKAARASEELHRRSDPELFDLYRRLIAKISEEAANAARKAVSANRVAEAVEHALTARRPKTRYVIGSDARFWLLLNLLPDRWRDWLILSELKK
jgi:NAD(P)-dependent dehydrogenase (short-subunit alcohol dehydrogenase family)